MGVINYVMIYYSELIKSEWLEIHYNTRLILAYQRINGVYPGKRTCRHAGNIVCLLCPLERRSKSRRTMVVMFMSCLLRVCQVWQMEFCLSALHASLKDCIVMNYDKWIIDCRRTQRKSKGFFGPTGLTGKLMKGEKIAHWLGLFGPARLSKINPEILTIHIHLQSGVLHATFCYSTAIKWWESVLQSIQQLCTPALKY